MPTDKIKTFLTLRRELIEEKRQLEVRLKEIEQVLQGSEPAVVAAPKARPARAAGKRRKRIKNAMSLPEAICKVATKPMTKQEILEAVLKLGYQFNTTKPLNTLSTALYTYKKKFRNQGGKFVAIS
jgi:hypothetical protein